MEEWVYQLPIVISARSIREPYPITSICHLEDKPKDLEIAKLVKDWITYFHLAPYHGDTGDSPLS